tara:strand:- start:15 stop:2336 length:2322 start_codon:yes stop_codon:yes gene_type:complete
MADNDIGNLISNYGDMSIEELGSSLLQRQSDIAAQRAKEAKKNRKFQQAIGLLTAGQAVFKNAVQKRLKEADDELSFNLQDNAEQSQQIKTLGRIGANMPDQAWFAKRKDMDVNTLTKEIMEDDRYGKNLQQNLAPVIDAAIKQGIPEEEYPLFKKGTSEYDTTFQLGMHNLISNYVSPYVDSKGNKTGKRNFEMYEIELRKLLNARDLDSAKLYEQAIAITPGRLNQVEKRYYARLKDEYANRGYIESFKDIFRKVGRRQEQQGKLNIFRGIENTDVYGSNINDILTTLNIEGPLITSIDKSLAQYRGSATQALVSAKADPDLIARSSLAIDSFGRNLGNKKLYNSDNTLKMSERGSWSWGRFMTDINKDEAQKQAFAKDVAGLTNAFQDDTDFALAAFTSSLEDRGEEVTDDMVQEFYQKITSPDNEMYRMNIAIAVAANEGFQEGGGLLKGKPEYYRTSFDEIVRDYKYDRFKGSIPVLLGEGIAVPSETNTGNYQEDASYNKMSVEDRKIAFDNQLKFIEQSKLSQTSKMRLIENLFDNVKQPEFTTPQEYLEAYPPESRVQQSRLIYMPGPGGGSLVSVPTNVGQKKNIIVEDKQVSDSIYKKKAVGKKVTSEAINVIVNMGSESEKDKKNIIGFLNDTANMESTYGTHRNTFTNKSGARGIMQIVPSQSLAELKRRIDIKNPTMVKYNEKLKSNFNIDLTTVTAEDLEIPIVNVAVARGYYMIFPDPIPTDKVEQAGYWLKNYNTGDGNATVNIYLKKNGYDNLIKE